MTAARNRSARIWLVMATIAVASIACARAVIQGAKTYTGPVFELLIANQSAPAIDPAGVPKRLQQRSVWNCSHASALRTAGPAVHAGLWLAMLPVLFVGLVSPLNLLSPRSVLCLGRTPSALRLPSAFQRPPPRFA